MSLVRSLDRPARRALAFAGVATGLAAAAAANGRGGVALALATLAAAAALSVLRHLLNIEDRR